MSNGLRIWLWVILVLNVIGIIGSVGTALLIPIAWVSVLLSVLIIAGISLLLFKQKRVGYYMVIGAALLGLIVNVAVGVNIIYAVFAAVCMPLITWLFLRNNWSLFD